MLCQQLPCPGVHPGQGWLAAAGAGLECEQSSPTSHPHQAMPMLLLEPARDTLYAPHLRWDIDVDWHVCTSQLVLCVAVLGLWHVSSKHLTTIFTALGTTAEEVLVVTARATLSGGEKFCGGGLNKMRHIQHTKPAGFWLRQLTWSKPLCSK